MTFKGLEDRFKSKASTIYGKYSTQDGSSDQPYLEYKPNNPNKNDTRNDSRMLPVGSVKRDAARLGKYLASGKGLMFLINQEVLQLGNTFSETRVINPLFVIANTVPYIHTRRPLATPASFAVRGNSGQASPASDPTVQGAGRLQVETSKKVIHALFGRGGKNSIISLLPSGNIIQNAINLLSLADKGSLGVNQRPELDFNGEYFSIALWKGFKKTHGFRSNLDSAAANLRVGNFRGAYESLRNAGRDVVNQVSSLFGRSGKIPLNSILPDGRDRLTPGVEGRRYFITDATDADRYLRDTVVFTTTPDGYEHSSVQMSFISRQPYTLAAADGVAGGTAGDVTVVDVNDNPSINSFVSGISNPVNALRRPFSVTGFASNFSNSRQIQQASNFLQNQAGVEVPTENPAEEAMLFNQLSLRNRYATDERMKFIKTQLDSQKKTQTAYWRTNQQVMGWGENVRFKPGSEVIINPTRRTGVTRYLSDDINTQAIFDTPGAEVSETQAINISRDRQDLINVWFFDFVNGKTIPFRAFISGLSESTRPEYDDKRYIGRNERNIVYLGVTRDVSFQLKVHAFSDHELENIWKKIDYLTGLCYPGDYNMGFMVPPFVKVTIGDLYKNQPCYIKDLQKSIEDGISWEVTPGAQVPHGVTMNISLSIIEKSQKKTGSSLYEFTTVTG